MRTLILLFLAFTSYSLLGQDARNGQGEDGKSKNKHERISYDKMEAQKVAFFTTQLDLTPSEAQEFWPIYNEYAKYKKEARMKKREKPNLDNLDEAQANILIDEFLENKQKELDLDKLYIEKFKQVLVPQKVIQLFILERRFKDEILKDVRRRLNHSK